MTENKRLNDAIIKLIAIIRIWNGRKRGNEGKLRKKNESSLNRFEMVTFFSQFIQNKNHFNGQHLMSVYAPDTRCDKMCVNTFFTTQNGYTKPI